MHTYSLHVAFWKIHNCLGHSKVTVIQTLQGHFTPTFFSSPLQLLLCHIQYCFVTKHSATQCLLFNEDSLRFIFPVIVLAVMCWVCVLSSSSLLPRRHNARLMVSKEACTNQLCGSAMPNLFLQQFSTTSMSLASFSGGVLESKKSRVPSTTAPTCQ